MTLYREIPLSRKPVLRRSKTSQSIEAFASISDGEDIINSNCGFSLRPLGNINCTGHEFIERIQYTNSLYGPAAYTLLSFSVKQSIFAVLSDILKGLTNPCVYIPPLRSLSKFHKQPFIATNYSSHPTRFKYYFTAGDIFYWLPLVFTVREYQNDDETVVGIWGRPALHNKLLLDKQLDVPRKKLSEWEAAHAVQPLLRRSPYFDNGQYIHPNVHGIILHI